MKKIIFLLIILLIIFLYFYYKKSNDNNLNTQILPFGYQISNVINASNKQNFFNLINKYGNHRDLDITNKILKINHIFAPTWGFKINNKNIIEFEMYFYIYNPINRNYESKSITVDKLEEQFQIKNKNINPITMYSIDYNETIFDPNYYYFTSSNEIVDIGYSEKNNKLNNHYYRYFPNTIDKKFKKYIDDKLINYKIKNMKTVFIADKLIRNFIGVYYDGITYDQLFYFIKKYKFNNELLKELDPSQNYSVSVDYNKNNDNIEKIGIYGLLY
jgi:hypothetical protein